MWWKETRAFQWGNTSVRFPDFIGRCKDVLQQSPNRFKNRLLSVFGTSTSGVPYSQSSHRLSSTIFPGPNSKSISVKMSKLLPPGVTRRVVKKSSSKIVPAGSSEAKKTIAVVHPISTQTQGLCEEICKVLLKGPTLLQKRVFKEALSKSALDPKAKVKSAGAQRRSIPAPTVATKRGPERVLQKISTAKTIQRTPKAEYISKSVKSVDTDASGKATELEITSQQIDPAHATESRGINMTVSTTSSLTVTTGGKQMKKSFIKKTVKNSQLAKKVNMNPAHVNRLVKEENEDVENTLKMIPPDLVSTSVEKFPLKKKLQNLRMNSESIALLEQSVIQQAPTADEVETETSPEVLASVIHAVEKGAAPSTAPNQIFNSLFPEVSAEQRVPLSSVAPGPLLDVVVPLGHPPQIFEEVLSDDLERTLSEVQGKQELPTTDVCVQNNIAAPVRQDEGEKQIPMLLEEEIPPWENANVQKMYALVGGDPIDLLDTTDPSILEVPEGVEEELKKGMDYFVDANTAPYETKVQLRGSRSPEWFPGYMAAFPHYPEIVRLAKSPSAVLLSAWKCVQPKVFDEESILMI